jgi:hypothetical protein
LVYPLEYSRGSVQLCSGPFRDDPALLRNPEKLSSII